MRIEILEHSRMTMTGNGILRSLQNNSLSKLDLLVREIIQNSLDAYDRKRKPSSIKIEFKTGEFKREALNSKFECLGDVLDGLGNKLSNNFIAISDIGTVGLNGDIGKKNNDGSLGNFEKLVYNIAKQQTQSDAGGSWGYGKSSYFKIGIGLVVFYSKYRDNNNEYKSRLAATFIEDEQLRTSLLNQINESSNGVAWFGDYDEDNKKSIPIVDEKIISDILNLFGLVPFENEKTGTQVIIPYVNYDDLLEDINTKKEFDYKNTHFYWKDDFCETLKNQIMMWYAPRLNNFYYYEYLNKPYLEVYINKEKILVDEEYPTYFIIQELYNFALSNNYSKEYGSKLNDISVESICYPGKITPSVGSIAYKKFGKGDLFGKNGNIASPYTYLGKRPIQDSSNRPIFCFTRGLGMIIDYQCNAPWAGFPPTSEDEFLIGVFVLNSLAEFKETREKLESYVRYIEMSDHSSWVDTAYKNNKICKVITKCINEINKKIKQKYESNEKSSGRKITGLSQMLGQLFLPTQGYGDSKSNIKGSAISYNSNSKSSKSNKKNRNKSYFNIEKIYNYDGNEITIDFSLFFGTDTTKASFSAFVSTENKEISANGKDGWENIFEKPFPVEITEMYIDEINEISNNDVLLNFSTRIQNDLVFDNGFSLFMLKTSKFDILNGILLTKPTSKSTFYIKGHLLLKTFDKNIVSKFILSKEGGCDE